MSENESNIIPNNSQETITQTPEEANIPPADENLFDQDNNVPAKKKGKKIAIISGITAAVLIGGGIAAYNLSDFVKNQVNLLLMKPEKYYTWVTEKNSSGFAEKAAQSYEEKLDKFNNGSTASIELKYNASDEAKDILIEKILEDSDDTPENNEILTDIINNTDDLSISLTSQSKKSDSMLSLGTNHNGDSIISLDLFLDLVNPKLFMRYPEIKEQWICMDFQNKIDSSIESSEDETTLKKVFEYYQEIIQDPTVFISPKELENAINNYSNVWIKSVADVERERREKISIGDITVKYTSLEVDIDGDLAARLLRNLIRELSDDKVIRRAVIDKLDLVSNDDYEDAFDTLLTSSKLLKSDEDEMFSVKTYIDPTGKIRGFLVCGNDIEFFYAMGKNKDDFSIEFSVTVEDTEMISLVLNAEETDKENYEGSVSLELDKEFTAIFVDSEEASEDFTITLDFEDMTIGSLENIRLNGKAVLHNSDIDDLRLKFSSKDNMQSITYSIEKDGIEYGDISLIFTTKDKASFEIPDANDSYMLDTTDSASFNFFDYVEYDEVVDYFTDLYIRLGVDEDTAAEIVEESLDDSAFNNDYVYKTEPDHVI
ncbi:MAG: hypothetical protein IKK47_00830 [Ruminococcus sp.]|nr:hypothetical protein [Ruminococcus sp.]